MASYTLFSILLAVVVSTICSCCEFSRSPLHILVILPEPEDSDVANSPLSYQPQEVLSSATQAVMEINNCTEVLTNYSVELIPIRTVKTDPHNALLQFYKQLLSRSDSLIGMVGVVSENVERVLLEVASHPGIDLVQLVDPLVPLDRNYPHTFTPHSSLTFHMEAAVRILLDLKWNRVGLVYNSTLDDPVYLRAARTFMSLIEQASNDINVVQIDLFSNTTVSGLENSKAVVFLCLLPVSVSIELISASQQKDLNHAWILVEYGKSLQLQMSDVDFNHVLIIWNTDFDNLLTSTVFNPLPPCAEERKVSDFVYLSIWELCLALNSSQQTIGDFGLSQFGLNENLTQAIESKLEESMFVQRHKDLNKMLRIYSNYSQFVGYFDAETKEFTLNVTIDLPGLGPNITYTYIIFSTSLKNFTAAVTGACYLFTTVVLLLFIYYRNQPEIKATSAWLSLCIFFACYLVTSGALNHFITSGEILNSHTMRVAICNVETYFVSLGVDILITTLLAKVLRIWRIFTLHGRTGKQWKDPSLLGFIGIVIGVKIVLLAIWTLVDPYTLIDVEKFVDTNRKSKEYEIAQQCESEYYFIWLLLVYGYSTAIGLVLVGASIKTRKIKQENFKDTKKINILITSLIFMALVCGSLWGVLRLIGNSIASKIVIGLVYCMIALLSEVFLFLPKILPAIFRQFNICTKPRKMRPHTESSLSTETSVVAQKLIV